MSITPDEPTTAESVSLGRRFFNPQTLISFVVALAILFFIATRVHIDVRETLDYIRRANPLLYIAAILVYYSSFIPRGHRWRHLLQNVGVSDAQIPPVRDLGEIIFLSWFANSVVPAKLGDLYRGYLMRRTAGLSISLSMGTIVAERLLDFSVLFVLLGISGLVSFSGRLPASILQALGALFGVLLIGAVGIFTMHGLTERVMRLLPHRAATMYQRFTHATVLSFRGRPVELLVLTVLAWLCEAGRFYFVALSLGQVVNPWVAIFIALAGALLTALPLTPGGLGFAEAGIAAALILYGMDKELAVSLALLDRTISYLSLIVFGVIVYLFSKKK